MTSVPHPFERFGDLTESDYRLIEVYQRVGVSLDQLPYTAAFEQIFKALEEQGEKRDRAAVFQRFLYIRKSGRLPRIDMGKAG